MLPTEENKIPVISILRESILIGWRKLDVYSKALAIPTALLAIIWAVNWTFFEHASELVAWAIWGMYKVAFVVFAVTCHRLVLLEDSEHPFRVRFSLRELKFLGWLIVVYAIVYFIVGVSLTVAMNVATRYERLNQNEIVYYGQLIFSIPAMYVLARLCLVFPGTAIDRRFSLRMSWNSTRGNGWRIAIIVGLYPWLIGLGLWLLSRENATVFEQVAVGLLFYVGLALEVFALSFTYKALDDIHRYDSFHA